MSGVSILMPVYNGENYIEDTVEQIINQTYDNWELIIVNDGSTDKTKSICEKLKQRDSRIKVINKENTGVSHTRNIALTNANEEYIAFVDSDDYIDEKYLEILINTLKENNADISICGFVERKISNSLKDDKLRTYYPKKYLHINEMKDLIMDFGNSELLNPLWNKLYKKSIIKKHNLKFKDNIKTGEDLIFNLEYFTHINKLSFTRECLYYYIRRNNNSITYQYVENMYEKGLEIHSSLEEFLKNMNFYTEENKSILYGNHLIGVFSVFLNLFHQDCKLTLKDKQKYINSIINKDYVKECADNRKNDKNIIGLVSLLIRLKSNFLIILVFYSLSIGRRIKNIF